MLMLFATQRISECPNPGKKYLLKGTFKNNLHTQINIFFTSS